MTAIIFGILLLCLGTYIFVKFVGILVSLVFALISLLIILVGASYVYKGVKRMF